MLVESYRISRAHVGPTADTPAHFAPLVTLVDDEGRVVWERPSTHVAHWMTECRLALGEPPWEPPLNVEIHLAAMHGSRRIYAVELMP